MFGEVTVGAGLVSALMIMNEAGKMIERVYVDTIYGFENVAMGRGRIQHSIAFLAAHVKTRALIIMHKLDDGNRQLKGGHETRPYDMRHIIRFSGSRALPFWAMSFFMGSGSLSLKLSMRLVFCFLRGRRRLLRP